MSRLSRFAPALGLVALMGVSACTTTTNDPNHGAVYTTTASQRAQNVQSGVITSVRTVELRSDGAQFAGALVGGALGGLAGNQLGGGSGKDILTVAGAVGGAVAGARVGEQQGRSLAQEWTVRLNNGRVVAVVQNGRFYIGQPVYVNIDNQGRARITAR